LKCLMAISYIQAHLLHPQCNIVQQIVGGVLNNKVQNLIMINVYL
jgi:hypothetical protein